MRKIKRPNISVKPREIFYHLKRKKQIFDLNEERIASELESYKPAALIDPGCVFASIGREDDGIELLLDTASASPWRGLKPRSITCAVATIGDRGFEAKLTAKPSNIVWAWAEVYLNKLTDLADDLIGKEAAAESLETGPWALVNVAGSGEFWSFVQVELDPCQKLGIKVSGGVDGGELEIVPALSRVWLVPWLSKKEKKKLQVQPV